MKPPQLLQCHACANPVSPQADSCPKCGQPFKRQTKTSVARGVFWGLFSFFILLPIGIFFVIVLLGASGAAISGFFEGREKSKANAVEAERIAEENQRKREESRVLIQRQKDIEEFEKLPEWKAAREKEEAERIETAKRQEAERLAHEKQLEEERLRPIREREAKIIAHQLREASNGLPSFQLIMGQRYLRGDGVETNLALARHWLTAAKTNGVTEAEKLLSLSKP